MDKWFEELLEAEDGRIVKIAYKDLLASHQSKFQKIDIYDTVAFGRMLVHDEVIMLTEADEAHYHEMIVHVAMNVHPNPQRVLIIGGGDGGTLREVLKHKQVQTAHLCEIDGDVIRLCKKYLPNLSFSFADPKAEIFREDGAQFIKKKKNFYHVIIVDSSDPIGPAEVLFKEQFYRDMFAALTGDGIVVTQSESFLFHKDIIKDIASFSRKIYPIYFYYYTMVPTYPSGVIGFSFCSKKYHPINDFKPEKVDALEGLKYYSKDMHKAAFVLPQGFAMFLESAE
ncbi:MAG: polyamine aminopropyltransferase [Candidatus Aminicenantes bacterium]|nr:polyamine aminopropyltransferase [Candidatus Aminicenantes bacterium]NIM78561.1 polyamine aminopropyltransferase [Candidatus Aminicenantes bacterium]NIN17807.1 polyamine aminopropyltransferase [Candidatus Aminicenantes bacterium]NIN41711.1 polyamine aminopropyltransferase [Candidatus Aminicenantes bacterium]NIN84460.1 polyamine aminopropyltransferase [Candidatus Aminicenantes bacterium]